MISMIYSDYTSLRTTTTVVSKELEVKNGNWRIPLLDIFLVAMVAIVKVIVSFFICFCFISQTKTYKRWKTTYMTSIALNILDDQRIRNAIRFNDFVTPETVSIKNDQEKNDLEV